MDSGTGGSIVLAAGPGGTITTGALNVTGSLEVGGQGLLVDTGAATFANGAALVTFGRITVAGATTFGSHFTLDNAELDLSTASTATLSRLTLDGAVTLSGNLTTAVLSHPGLTSFTLGTPDAGATFGVTGSSPTTPVRLPALTIVNDVALVGTFQTPSLVAGFGTELSLMAGDALTVTGDVVFAPNFPFCSVVLDGGTLSVGGTFHAGLSAGRAPNTIENGGHLTVGALVDAESGFSIEAGGALTVNGDVSDSTYNGVITLSSSQFSVSGAGATLNVKGTLVSGNDTIGASDGAAVQLAALAQDTSGDGITLTADASSSIHIGPTGTAAAGTLAIGSGVSVSESGRFSAPVIRDNGTLAVAAGHALTLDGAIEGTGTVSIGAGATLTVGGDNLSSSVVQIAFSGLDGILALDTSDLNASNRFASPIAGFGEGNAIDFSGVTITSAQYANGVLDLANGATVVAALQIGTGYNNDFLVVPVAGKYQIDYLEAKSAPSAGTPAANAFQWIAGLAGGWNNKADWANTTTGHSPAAVAPGAHDPVTIGGALVGTARVIVGNGNAYGLSVTIGAGTTATTGPAGETLLDGIFNLGAGGLSMAQGQCLLLDAGDTLAVAGNATFGNACIATSNGGTMTVGGDATLGTASYLTLNDATLKVTGTFFGDHADGTNPVSNTIENGGTFTAGALADNGTRYAIGAGSALTVNGNVSNSGNISGFVLSGTGAAFTVAGTFIANNDFIDVSGGAHVRLAALSGSNLQLAVSDASSSIGIGGTGAGKAGTITIAAGANVTVGGTFLAPSIVDNGTLTASGSLQFNGPVTGSGTLAIGAGSSLLLYNGATLPIAFTGESGVLSVVPSDFNASNHFVSTIGGFDSTDTIILNGGFGTLTDAHYAGGALDLYDGTTIAASFDIGAGYQDRFSLLPLGGGAYRINDLGVPNAAPAGTASADSYQWTGAGMGAWNDAANWADTTANQAPAAVAPGANDTVVIDEDNTFGVPRIVTGDGDAHALTLQSKPFAGQTFVLNGEFDVGAGGLAVTSSYLWLFAGSSLAVAGNASFSGFDAVTLNGAGMTVAGNATFTGGEYLVLNGGTVSVTGTFTGGLANTFVPPNTVENGGSLTVGTLVDSGTAFSIAAGSALTVHHNVSDTGAASNFLVSGAGAKFTVMGTFVSGNDTIDASDGAQVQLKALAEDAGHTGITLTVGDTASSIEIGTNGGVAAGALSIDSGVSVTEAGVFSAPIVADNGTLVVAAGETLTLDGAIAGSGLFSIGAGSTLTLNAASVSATDRFVLRGSDGTLDLNDPTGFGGAKILDFASGDAVDLAGAWSFVKFGESGGVGTLTLTNGTNKIALKFAGDFTADNFAIDTGATTAIGFAAGADRTVFAGQDPSSQTAHDIAAIDNFDFAHDRFALSLPGIDATAAAADAGRQIYLAVDPDGRAGYHGGDLAFHLSGVHSLSASDFTIANL